MAWASGDLHKTVIGGCFSCRVIYFSLLVYFFVHLTYRYFAYITNEIHVALSAIPQTIRAEHVTTSHAEV